MTPDVLVQGLRWTFWVLAYLAVAAYVVVRINVLLSYYANDLFSALQVTFQP